MSSDPINPAVPPYYRIGGMELREGHRLHYGADRLADHLVMSADEYIKRAGNKPDVPRVDDLRKAARCLTQAINALEGRHVSDDGTATPGTAHAPPPAGLRDAAIAMLAAMVGPHGPSVMRRRQAPAGNAPNHGHSVPGVWDASNGPDLGGKPCEWCAAWNRFVDAVEAEPAQPAPAPPSGRLDLSRVVGYVRRNRTLHTYEIWADAASDPDASPWDSRGVIDSLIHHAADGRVIDARDTTPEPTPTPPPVGLDLSRVRGFTLVCGTLYLDELLNEYTGTTRVDRVVLRTADGRKIDAREATPPPPAPAIPELPAGTMPTVPGIYVVRHPHGTVGAYDIQDFSFWASRLDCRFAGPIPPPSFATPTPAPVSEGREGGQDAKP